MASADPLVSHSREAPVPLAVKFGYSLGNLGKSSVWTSFETVLLYFLTVSAGIPVASAGALLAALMVWDGLADLLVSYRTDRTGRPDGLARLIRIGAPLCGVGFALIFVAPILSGALVTMCAVVLSRVGYTLCDIGHNTLLVHVSRSERDSARVSALRLIFSALGAGGVSFALVMILALRDPAQQGHAFIVFGAVAGSTYLVTLLISAVATRGVQPARRKGLQLTLGQAIAQLAADRTYAMLLGIVVVQSMLIPFFPRILPFFAMSVLGDARWSGWALASITLGQSLSLPGWLVLAGRMRLGSMMISAHMSIILAVAALAIGYDTPVAWFILCLFGVGLAGMNTALWASLALSVKTRLSAAGEATAVGLFLAALKAATGVGTWLITTVVVRLDLTCSGCAQGSAGTMLIWSLSVPLIGSALVLILARLMSRDQQPRRL